MKRVGGERKQYRSKVSGFTIVELLIVVVVIAILAAITIVAYNGIQNRAKDSAVAVEAKQVGTKIQAYAVEHSDIFPDATTLTSTLNISPSNDGSTPYQYTVAADGRSFCLTITKSATSYYVSNTKPSTKGACDGHGSNGVSPIANLAPNPKIGTTMTGWSIQTSGSTGINTREATGGPTPQVQTFIRRSTTVAPTSSPLNVVSTGTGLTAVPVSGGKTYVASGYVRSSCALGAGIRFDLVPYDDTGASLGSLSGAINPNTPDTWMRISQTRTFASTVSFVRLQLAFSGPTTCPATSTYDVTGVMLSEVSNLPVYADGDSSGWAWTGTPNNSSSTGPATY